MRPLIILTGSLSPNCTFVRVPSHPSSFILIRQPLPLLPMQPPTSSSFLFSTQRTFFIRFLLESIFALLSASLLSPHGQVSYNFYSLVPPCSAALLSICSPFSPLLFSPLFWFTYLSALIRLHILFRALLFRGAGPFWSSTSCSVHQQPNAQLHRNASVPFLYQIPQTMLISKMRCRIYKRGWFLWLSSLLKDLLFRQLYHIKFKIVSVHLYLCSFLPYIWTHFKLNSRRKT